MYLVYRLLLSKNTSFIVKRIYLLFSLPIAFILPLIHFTGLKTNNLAPIGDVIDFNFEKLSEIQFLPTTHEIGSGVNIDAYSLTLIIYLIISALLLVFVLRSFVKILKSIQTNRQIHKRRLCYVISDEYTNPFSFFKYLFTSTEKDFEETPEYLHELAHIQQLHSIDRLLVELLVPMLWINPFIYLFKKSLIEVHEHLADNAVLKAGMTPVDYQNYLYLQLKSGLYLKMTSNFNYSLTKKRITMISKNISKRKSILRTAISIILVTGIFVFYGFNNTEMIDPLVGMQITNEKQIISNPVPSILPLKAGGNYYIGSYYGMRKHPYLGKMKMHEGIDIVAEKGTEIIAPADGTVIEMKEDKNYGKYVKIKHGEEFVTLYAHLSGFKVKTGDIVKTSDVIGYVGNTGLSTRPHLHYEIRKYPDAKPITYYNPADYIKNIKEIPDTKSKK